MSDLEISRSEYVSTGLEHTPGHLCSSLFMVVRATTEYGATGVSVCLAVSQTLAEAVAAQLAMKGKSGR